MRRTISPIWARVSLLAGTDMAKKETKSQAKVGKVMSEFKAGTLHSGKGGPVVKSKKQAVAIAMSQAKIAKAKKK